MAMLTTSVHPHTPIPAATSLPMLLPVGGRYRIDDRTVRLERIHDDDAVELIDLQTLGRVQVRDPQTSVMTAPTLDWLRQMYREGRAHALDRAATPCSTRTYASTATRSRAGACRWRTA